MNATVRCAVLSTLLLGFAPPASSTPVYKWVDEAGMVNYGSEPPPGARAAKAKALDASAARVSSYDPAQAGLDPASQLRRNGSTLRARAEQLQSQLDQLKGARQSAAELAALAKRKRREECERQHRVDCELDQEEYGGYPRIAVAYRPLLAPYVVGAVPVTRSMGAPMGGARGVSFGAGRSRR